MAGRLIRQPNGLFAWFSDVVADVFGPYGMTEEEAVKYCPGSSGVEAVRRAKEDRHPLVASWWPHSMLDDLCVYCAAPNSRGLRDEECERRALIYGEPDDGLRRWRDAVRRLDSPWFAEALTWGYEVVEAPGTDDPLSGPFLETTGDRLRSEPRPGRLDVGYHGHPLRRVARELLRLEEADETDVAWVLCDLARSSATDISEQVTRGECLGAIALIAGERRRQLEEEGYGPDHDDVHTEGELAATAAWLAAPTRMGITGRVPAWGKDLVAKHSENRVLQLVIAGALIAAELDRLQRVQVAQEAAAPPPVHLRFRHGTWCGEGTGEEASGSLLIADCKACWKAAGDWLAKRDAEVSDAD